MPASNEQNYHGGNRFEDDKRSGSRRDNKASQSRGDQVNSGQRKKSDRRRVRLTVNDVQAPRKLINLKAMRFCLRTIDVIVVTLLIGVTIGIMSGYVGTNGKPIAAPVAASMLGALLFLVSLFSLKAHEFAARETFKDHIFTIVQASLIALGLWLTTALILKPVTFRPDTLATAGTLAAGALMIMHTIYYGFARRLHRKAALTPTIVMLGATESARRLIEENARSKDLNIIAIFDERLARAPLNIHGVPVIGKLEDLLSWGSLPYIDRIVVTLPGKAMERKRQFAQRMRRLPNRLAFVSDEFENFNHVQQRLTDITAISLRDLGGKTKATYQIVLKRLTDITVSLIALTLGAPILLLVGLMIKMDSPGPMLFKQPRHGFNNRVFEVFKFRSLRVEDEDKKAAKQVTAGDSRVTKIGRIIRKTSIDELPQLINVLRGDMTLVGPRPHAIGMRTGDIESYKLVDDYAHRHRMKPGMTGWAQINGSRGPLHNAADVKRRVELDIEYIERSSFFFDWMIMIKTLPCLLGDSENIR
ncbi:MAG: exopolysaccharide biosynthesis polyprenyl glycosylphosphotransferase [Maricaulaceae bacterium]